MKKVLSVIIPVYNMEKYIRQCLESLMIKEVLDKIEILVVLDGSTDRSEEIAMEYAKAHPYFYIYVPEGRYKYKIFDS